LCVEVEGIVYLIANLLLKKILPVSK